MVVPICSPVDTFWVDIVYTMLGQRKRCTEVIADNSFLKGFLKREIFFDLMTSDRKLKASREGSK